MLTNYDIGRAYRAANESLGADSVLEVSLSIRTNTANIHGRYSGRSALKVSELIEWSRRLGLDPVAVLSKMMGELSGKTWADLGKKIGTSAAIAKRRFEIAKNRYGLNDDQLWSMIQGEQVDI